MSQKTSETTVPLSLIFEREKISNLNYNLGTKKFSHGINLNILAKYYKGLYSNIDRFKSRYIDEKVQKLYDHPEISDKDKDDTREFFKQLISVMETVEPFKYDEAFSVSDSSFQSIIWDTIDIGEMVQKLNGKRIKTEGIKVNHKKFSETGDFLGMEEYDNVYEIWEAEGGLLRSELKDTSIYALKCWCTSTNKEHYIWIEDKYKDDPLEAVASTMRIHANILPFVKELKRQGDILLFEMKDGVEIPEPEGEVVPLTKDQYFGLLTAQS